MRSDYIESLELLIDEGHSPDAIRAASFDIRDEHDHGHTPMIIACKYGSLRVAQWLYDHGAADEKLEELTLMATLHCTGLAELVIFMLHSGSIAWVLQRT